MAYELDPTRVLILSIVVLWVGNTLTTAIPPLKRFSIPIAVTGGLLSSIVVALLAIVADVRVTFDLSLRDTLLLVFFSTIGLSAKLRLLKEGGRTLAILGLLAAIFLCAQNAVGMVIALSLGDHAGYGLIAGSVSFAGGHGTALTWGALAEDAGLERAAAFGLTFATFGLICGGLVGGPIANHLLRRHSLTAASSGDAAAEGEPALDPDEERVSVTSRQVIRTLLLLAICVGVGEELNRVLGALGLVLPGFLTAMGVGILLTNLADVAKQPVEPGVVNLFNQVSLHLFLAMSLMSMQLTQLAGNLGAIALVLVFQIALAVAFAIFVVFRFCGRDYDAVVIAAGFSGLGLGATPVGVANMNAVTSRSGPSPKAFLVVPLVGAFLLDIINAFVIQLHVQLM